MAAENKATMVEIIGTSKKEADDRQDQFEAILKELPKEYNFYNYQGFWVPHRFIKGVIYAQDNFVARDDDIILTSCPKHFYVISMRTH